MLVIDDDRIQLDITRRMLVRNKVRCECCRTVRELMAALRERTYDLLLSDIQMPDMDGYRILDLLRSSNMENARTIPVLAVTACADDEEHYISFGFAGCLRKPFSMDELISAVSRMVVKKRGERKEPRFSRSSFRGGKRTRGRMLGGYFYTGNGREHPYTGKMRFAGMTGIRYTRCCTRTFPYGKRCG